MDEEKKDPSKMNDFDELEFELDAYTPATIPMERLAMYMAALAKLFGSVSSVHFDRLETGSTCVMQKVDYEAIPKVVERLELLNSGNAANDEKAAFDDINKLCAADNAIANIYKRKNNIRLAKPFVVFEGRNLPKPVVYGPFSESVTIDGELVRIGGKDDTAHAQIRDQEGRVWSGEMKKDLAAEIAKFLYNGTLRIRGKGNWTREVGGKWVVKSLKITEFEHLKEDTLLGATTRLRSLKDTNWHSVENMDEYIRLSRGDDEAVH